ncbi:MAG: nucleotide pyrophosphohydrolase [Candidatus Electrothrix sp. AR3]|nr:nucleotide pyrophosphohydrolase [Candidatus Electrothrix sp. AR3]
MINRTEAEQDVNPFQRLDTVVKALRSEGGCPWDKKQTAISLKKYLLEEAAELAEAIDQGDPLHICEESGDLYFILALLTAIFEEQGHFSAQDALHAASTKMIRRHPHVFAADQGNVDKMDNKQLRAQWERIKQEEKLAIKGTKRG